MKSRINCSLSLFFSLFLFFLYSTFKFRWISRESYSIKHHSRSIFNERFEIYWIWRMYERQDLAEHFFFFDLSAIRNFRTWRFEQYHRCVSCNNSLKMFCNSRAYLCECARTGSVDVKKVSLAALHFNKMCAETAAIANKIPNRWSNCSFFHL